MSPSSPPEPNGALVALCRRRMEAPLPADLAACLEPLRREAEARLETPPLATLLYGSCLWRGSVEGVPDLLVVVDDYASCYRGWLPRAANALLAPNVFALMAGGGDEAPLRAKVSVVSLADLQRAVRPDAWHAFFWARLCQPTALLAARDEALRTTLAECAAASVETFVSMALPRALRENRAHPERALDPVVLWCSGFEATYRAEWRFESRRRSRSFVDADPDYYREATEAALKRLESQGAITGTGEAMALDARVASESRRRWALRARSGKLLAALRLIKNAFTFGEWAPYVLWKMERHTGVRIELNDAQRRHPFLHGWPVIARVLRERLLR